VAYGSSRQGPCRHFKMDWDEGVKWGM
jgi:hypothetical protein